MDREHDANLKAVKAVDRRIARIKREMKKLREEMALDAAEGEGGS